ncbi:MAG: glycosyl transferase, partial [Planctomycetes bacterium]|nr:glycosyl transferase [Planctomycetota bacterium]
MRGGITRVDLHVHSSWSKRPSIWLMQKIGCPESFTAPETLYQIAKRRGMDLVTISDHNVLDGSLEVASAHEDAFLSEEVTTYFPADRCKVHVLVHDLTEKQHDDIQGVRENIFEFVDYLNAEKLRFCIAHPFAAVNDRLTVDHFEKLLLLFKVFELNGDHDSTVNDALRAVLSSLRAEDMERLADRHGIEPKFKEPWKKYLLGGSDDHSSLNIAGTYTEVVGDCGVQDYLDAVYSGCGNVIGGDSSPRVMAHTIYGITYQFYKNKFGLDKHVNKDVLLRFLDRSLQTGVTARAEGLLDRLFRGWKQSKSLAGETPGSVMDVLRHESTTMITEDEELRKTVEAGNEDNEKAKSAAWFHFVDKVSNKVLLHFGNHIFERFAGARLFDIFHSLGSAGALYSMLSPYFVSYAVYSTERSFSRTVLDRFVDNSAKRKSDGIKIAHFTDTYFEVNGVAKTLKKWLRLAQDSDRDLNIFTCSYDGHKGGRGVRAFEPVGVYSLPLYPEQKLFFP